MSKKEIRRAARDAFPKAKGASSAKRGRSGAYSKRTYQAKPRGATTSGARNVAKPPSVKRSIISGFVVAVLFFLVMHWGLPAVFNTTKAPILTDLVFAVVGMFLFAGANYLSEGVRYRRYLRKKEGSGK